MKTYRLSSNGALAQNSSGGKLLKWRVDDTFIKTSTFDTTALQPSFLYESYAEVIAYRIAKQLGFNAVPYRLCKVIIDNNYETVACESQNFLNKDETYISIGRLMLNGTIPKFGYNDISAYNYIQNRFQNIQGFNNLLAEMIILDTIILNDDRHYGNFGLTQNGITKAAPIFDNGNSLFCHKHIENMEYKPDLIQYLRCKPFSIWFDIELEMIAQNINIRIDKDKLIRYTNQLIEDMINNYELPYQRGIFIKELLKDRINKVAGILAH